MLAGRPHEAVGNGSPRWMTVAPREREHRTRPTGRLTPFILVTCGGAAGQPLSSVTVPPERDGTSVPRSPARGSTPAFFAPVRRQGIVSRA